MKDKSNFIKKANIIKSIKQCCNNRFNISLENTYHTKGENENDWNIILNSNNKNSSLYARFISNLSICKERNIKSVIFRHSDTPRNSNYSTGLNNSYIFYFYYSKEEIKQINNFITLPNYTNQITPSMLVNLFIKGKERENLLNTYEVKFLGLLNIDNEDEKFSDLSFTHISDFESEVPYVDTISLPNNLDGEAKLSLQLLYRLKSNNLVLLNSNQFITESSILKILEPLIQLTKVLSHRPPIFSENHGMDEYSKIISDYWLITLNLNFDINDLELNYKNYSISFNTLISDCIKNERIEKDLSYISESDDIYSTSIFKKVVTLLNQSFDSNIVIKNEQDLFESLEYIKLMDY